MTAQFVYMFKFYTNLLTKDNFVDMYATSIILND